MGGVSRCVESGTAGVFWTKASLAGAEFAGLVEGGKNVGMFDEMIGARVGRVVGASAAGGAEGRNVNEGIATGSTDEVGTIAVEGSVGAILLPSGLQDEVLGKAGTDIDVAAGGGATVDIVNDGFCGSPKTNADGAV